MTGAAPQATLEMPTLFGAADTAASDYQKRFFVAKTIELGAIALGAIVGALNVNALWGAAGVAAVICFGIALAIRLSGVGARAERRWYDARAAAESIKSLAWSYAVGGEAFRKSMPDAERELVTKLGEILAGLPDLNVPADARTPAGATPDMAELRASDQQTRCDRYHAARINDQVSWYSNKSKFNKARSEAWSAAVVVAEGAAIVAGLLRMRGAFDVDLLGVFGAIGAGMIAWMQAKNYTSLSEAYAVTSHEVGLVAHSVRSGVPEDQWAQSVHDAEAAFSREHTMWRARQQGRQVA